MIRGKVIASVLVGVTFLLCPSLPGQTMPPQADEAKIQRYSQEAKEALARNDLDAAVQALEKLSRLTPAVAEIHGNLGMTYYALGRYRQAAEAFARALKVNPNLPNAKPMLGICLAQTGRAKEAVPILEPAFRHPPNNEIGRVIGWQLQRAYVALDQPGKALAVTEEMLHRYPDDPETLYDAAHLYGDRALQTTIRLVDLAPESAWAHLALGEAFDGQMQYGAAINEYRTAIKADAGIPGIHFRLGRALLRTPRDEKTVEAALEAFEQEVAIDPEDSGAWYEIGEVQRRRGQLEQALQSFQKAVENHPEFEDAHIGLARTLINLNRSQNAVPHLEAAIRLNPDNKVSHFLLARIYKGKGDTANYEKEMALFEERRKSSAAARPVSNQMPSPFPAAEVTKQELDPDSPE